MFNKKKNKGMGGALTFQGSGLAQEVYNCVPNCYSHVNKYTPKCLWK